LAKSKISEKHTLSVEGVLDLENDITIEVEEHGVLELKDLLKNFDGENIKLIANKTDNII
jgi:ABC-type hemin transport system substrate-binding protein